MKKYKLIYADPPWKYNNKNTGRYHYNTIKNFNKGMISGASNKYPCMSINELLSMNLENIMNDNCVLFLWSTTPLLDQAFKLLFGWGFDYKTTFYWDKKNTLGMGFWFRNNVEPCLIGVRGDIKPFRLQIPNIISRKPSNHSKKPSDLYSIMESLDLKPRIELFARDRRDGWDCYGNQLSKTIQKLIT